MVSITPIHPDPTDKEEISENGNGIEAHKNGNCSEAHKNGNGIETHNNGNEIEAHENGNEIAEKLPRNGGENGVQTKTGAKTDKEAEKNMKNKLNSNKKWKLEYLCLETKTSHFVSLH